MKKIIYIIIILLSILFLMGYHTATAESPIEDIVYNKALISDMIGYYSNQYGVSEKVMHRIVSGESTYNPKPEDGDKKIICPRGVNKGKPVRARGLVQITECYFPEVTDEQAYNPYFSLDFLASKLAKGQGELWSTY